MTSSLWYNILSAITSIMFINAYLVSGDNQAQVLLLICVFGFGILSEVVDTERYLISVKKRKEKE